MIRSPRRVLSGLSASLLLNTLPLQEAGAENETGGPPPAIRPALTAGVNYLVKSQDRDGSWGSSRWTGGVDRDPVPGSFHSFDVAVTALCLEALLPYRETSGVPEALQRAEAYLWRELPRIRRPDPYNLPNVWSYCYGIQTLCALLESNGKNPAREQKLRKQIRELMAGLSLFETPHGGWFYYASATTRRPDAPSASFVNAAVLVALHRAHRAGVPPDPKLVERALKSTRLQRKPDSSYLYSIRSPLGRGSAMNPINRPAGSLGRSQACNYALRIWGEPCITTEVLDTWLQRLAERQGWLDMGRKRPLPHESHAAVAGYFYYFGHYYAGLCLRELPAEKRAIHAPRLAEILITRQETDGSWFDYPLYSYHKPYGTAFALMTLTECLRAAPF